MRSWSGKDTAGVERILAVRIRTPVCTEKRGGAWHARGRGREVRPTNLSKGVSGTFGRLILGDWGGGGQGIA